MKLIGNRVWETGEEHSKNPCSQKTVRKERSRESDLCRGMWLPWPSQVPNFRCGDMFLHLPLLKARQARESGITYSPKPTSHINEDENMLWKDLSLLMTKKEACTQGKLFLREEKWTQASAERRFTVGQHFPRRTPNDKSCRGGYHSSTVPPAVWSPKQVLSVLFLLS